MASRSSRRQRSMSFPGPWSVAQFAITTPVKNAPLARGGEEEGSSRRGVR